MTNKKPHLIAFYFIAFFASYAEAKTLDECISEKKNSLIESFSAQGSVRCEGSGLSGRGDSNNSTVCYAAAPGYSIIGNVSIQDVSNNRGSYGQASYVNRTDGKPGVGQVCVPITCQSPNQPFGPGAWMEIKVNGNIVRDISDDEVARMTQQCLIEIGNN